jgi:periplasmic divalent cation tolerance protein
MHKDGSRRKVISVYITCKDEEEAEKIAKHLLDEKLIVCANMFPIKSLYWWKGKIEKEAEFAIIAKTKKEKFDKIKEQVKKVHSYEIPCIESWDIDDAHEPYLKWLEEEI